MSTEKKTVDELTEMFMAAAKDTTNPKRPEKIRYTIPTSVISEAMASQGVPKEVQERVSEAVDTVSKTFRNVSGLKLRDEILKNRSDKEILSKISITGKGEIYPRSMRITDEVNGERRGMTIPSEGKPSKEFVNYGTGRTVIEITSSLNEQREKTAELIKKTYEEINK